MKHSIRAKLISAFLIISFAQIAAAQTDIRELKLKDWQPRSMMVTKETKVDKAAFPVIDIHNHLGSGKERFTPERVNRILAEMDAAGVRTVINLDGTWDSRLKETIEMLDNEHPDWLFGGGQYPPREELLAQLERVIAGHPRTTYISTHFGNNAEDLGAVARQLDKYPNMMVDIDARISELGRQPYTARRFMIK